MGHWCEKGNPFQVSVAFHTETSHLICSVSQMTGFYMKYNPDLKWINMAVTYALKYSSTKNFRKMSKKKTATELLFNKEETFSVSIFTKKGLIRNHFSEKATFLSRVCIF